MDLEVRPVSMVMTCDDAVEMTFMDGSRVQLSPCGSYFIYDPPSSQIVSHLNPGPGPSHPLYTSTRTQQRTCFITSVCRSKVKAALEFRNRFASRPFLCSATNLEESSPLELYADINKVEWSNSSGQCSFTLHPDHSLELTSVDSLATVILSPNSQDFSVKYLCKLQPEGNTPVGVDRGTYDHDRQQVEFSEDNQRVSPEESRRPRCKFWYTWVVQNHSVAHCPWYWKRPLDLLLNHNEEMRKALNGDESISDHKKNDVTSDPDDFQFQTHSSPLPPSLPLSCDQSHLHKHHWRSVKQHYAPGGSGEADTLTMYGRKVSVLLLGGVVYRLFWDAFPSIEIYPGNGDVIMSHDERGSFFKLIKVCSEGALKELMISVTNSPPDPPHSSYSIADLVRRGSRLLQCISVHQRTIGVGDNLVCWQKMKKEDISASASLLVERSIIPGLGQLESYTNGLIRGYFNDDVIMETMAINRVKQDGRPVDLQTAEDEAVFTVLLSDGCRRRVTYQYPGAYLRHMKALMEWQKCFEERFSLLQAKEDSSNAVQAELSRIRNLTYIIDASNDGRVIGCDKHDYVTKEDKTVIKDIYNTYEAHGTDLGSQGGILHADQTLEKNSMTKDDIAKALQDTALAVSDINGFLGQT